MVNCDLSPKQDIHEYPSKVELRKILTSFLDHLPFLGGHDRPCEHVFDGVEEEFLPGAQKVGLQSLLGAQVGIEEHGGEKGEVLACEFSLGAAQQRYRLHYSVIAVQICLDAFDLPQVPIIGIYVT